jgi:hypothetical protein
VTNEFLRKITAFTELLAQAVSTFTRRERIGFCAGKCPIQKLKKATNSKRIVNKNFIK